MFIWLFHMPLFNFAVYLLTKQLINACQSVLVCNFWTKNQLNIWMNTIFYIFALVSLCVQVLCDWTKTDLDSSEGGKCLLTRSQRDDVSFDQQTDRQINQLGVAVRPVKGPWRGRGCVQIRVERWRPPGFTHAPWQIVWGRRRRRRGESQKAVIIWVVYHFKYDDKWDV